MLYKRKRTYDSKDYVIRPSLRMLGALFAGLCVAMLLLRAKQLVQLAAVPPEQCNFTKGRLLCEIGSWINANTPPALQGPLAAVAHICFALLFLWVMWLLLKPLVAKYRPR